MNLYKRIKRKNFIEKLPTNAKLVARPSRFGNPYPLTKYDLETSLQLYDEWLNAQLLINEDFLKPLKNKDLVCYCDLDQPCHADIIIKKLKQIYN